MYVYCVYPAMSSRQKTTVTFDQREVTKRKRTNNDLQNTTQKTNDRESHLVMVSYVKRTIKNGKNNR
jgi:hypothetical protein